MIDIVYINIKPENGPFGPELVARCDTAAVSGSERVFALDSAHIQLIRSVTAGANMLNGWGRSWPARGGGG